MAEALLGLSCLALTCVAPASLSSCDSDAAKRKIGVACASGGQCESGICAQSVCIDPAVCAEALGTDALGNLVVPCTAGISELALSPDPATPDGNGQVQFTLTGTFTSDTAGTVVGTDDPRPTEETGGAGRGEFGLTATTDLTAVAVFTSDNPELVTFDAETPGLATIDPSVTEAITVTATIAHGDFTKQATAQLAPRSAVDGGAGELPGQP